MTATRVSGQLGNGGKLHTQKRTKHFWFGVEAKSKWENAPQPVSCLPVSFVIGAQGGVSVCTHAFSSVCWWPHTIIYIYKKKGKEKNISTDTHTKQERIKKDGEERRRYREVIMYRDYLYSIDLLGRIVNTRDERRCALSADLRRADGTWKARPAQAPHTHTRASR